MNWPISSKISFLNDSILINYFTYSLDIRHILNFQSTKSDTSSHFVFCATLNCAIFCSLLYFKCIHQVVTAVFAAKKIASTML